MYLTLITFFHIAICVLLILIVLLQHGRGADMGATFGGGSNTLFGASGADNLLTRVTTILAFLFMGTSVILASGIRAGSANKGSLFESLPTNAPVTAPATPLSSAAPASQESTAPAGAEGESKKVSEPVNTSAGSESSATNQANSTGNKVIDVVDANASAGQTAPQAATSNSNLTNEKAVAPEPTGTTATTEAPKSSDSPKN